VASPRVKAKLSAVDQISGVVRKVGIGINLGLVRPLKAAASAGISTGKMFGKLGALITGATGFVGAAVARRLLSNADIVIENFRPGVMDKLGLGSTAELVRYALENKLL